MDEEQEKFNGIKVVDGRYTEDYKKFIQNRNIEASRRAKKAETKESSPSAQERLAEFRARIAEAERKVEENWRLHRDEFDKIIQKHLPAIRVRFRSALVKNEYGGVESDTRPAEVVKLLQAENIIGATAYSIVADEIAAYIQEKIDDLAEISLLRGFDPESIPLDGHEFENWVAESLRKFGWTTMVTKGSGDQGVDVIARKQLLSVGIQCKLYSGNVGNSAVQEILSGCKYYNLSLCAVVSNAQFTSSAIKLAAVTGVALVHVTDLPFLESFLSQQA